MDAHVNKISIFVLCLMPFMEVLEVSENRKRLFLQPFFLCNCVIMFHIPVLHAYETNHR